MKKILTFGVIFSFATAAAFAEDKKDEPKIQITPALTSFAHAVSYTQTTKDSNGDKINGSFSEVRFRPTLTFTNGSIDGVLQLQYDTIFGADSSNSADNDYVGLESKHKTLKVREAYLSTKVDDVAGLKLTGGVMPYDFPLVFGDTAPMFGASYEAGMLTANLYYGKTYEGDKTSNSDDSQFGILDLSFKAGDNTIRPALFYVKTKKNADPSDTSYSVMFRDSQGVIAALAANLVFGKAGLDLAGAYINGKDKSGTETLKYSSYAADAALYIKPNDDMKFSLFGTYISGDDDTTGDNKDSSFLDGTLDGKSSGINNWRLFILEDGGTFGTGYDPCNGGKYTNSNGYMVGGLMAEITKGKVSGKLTAAYARLAKAASSQKKDMGIETDLNIGYAVTKGATLFVEGAFLKTGKAYGDSKQNAHYISAGLSASL
jgi:hypothetical protein